MLTPSLDIFRHQPYRHYWFMRQSLSAARQMQAVAIGWQVYDVARETRSIEESALMLGFVGLAQFAPVFLLSLVGGQAADRLDRKLILVVTNLVRVACALVLAISPFYANEMTLWLVFSAAIVLGVMHAFSPAAASALLPRIVPRDDMRQAIAWNSLGFQAAAIGGPAIGGLLYILGPTTVYLTSAALLAFATLAIGTARTPKHEKVTGQSGWKMTLQGLRYVRDNKVVLGAISLDLVVVLFGGVTALLPVFARDVLMTDTVGLGLLRTAPAIGAAVIAFLLATRPLTKKIGIWMLGAIAVYGIAMIGFALSTVLLLSLIALAVTGAADMISVFIRQSIIQLATPMSMRGRVSSVEFIFISASNELGEFESGVAARFLGPIGAVLLGGAMALVTAAAWFRLFPQLAHTDELEHVEDDTEKA
ncbi:MFS transporter [Maricaulis parjimensis]|uniref:MFS transporter n=1 Tax=Maricaulis parjimensis TaxID=144023 RepID=UPI00193A007D|nr:MFS transporter [Maricaulis parjimensis]